MDLSKKEDVLALIGGTYQNKGECITLRSKLKIHANGEMPRELIETRRPSESEEIKKYRASIYVPITQKTVSKVIHSLEKIRRAQDWNIQYTTENIKWSTIAHGESLQDYCETKYPGFTSITNWAFSELLKSSLIDANGIVAVVLDSLPKNKTEYTRPVARFFGCDRIVCYVENEYICLKSEDTTTFQQKKGRGMIYNTNGAIYYILTPNQFVKYEQTGANEFTPKQVWNHNIGKLPAWKVGGLFYKRKNNDTIFESRIAAMVPSLNEAAREYSDLQAEIMMHIHSERYEYTNTECPHCHGTGFEKGEDGKQVHCSQCKGMGRVANSSPYGVHLVDAARAGETQVPTPPIGYIQKDTAIATLQDQRVRQHQKDALAAVNMEFLAESPLDQSGVAKAYDANELNNFVNAVAEDLVRNLDNVYYFINEYRYRVVVSDQKKREEMLPKINVPTKFDIANTTLLMEELKGAKDANVNPEILRVLETNYAKMQFNTDPEVAKRLETVFDLDPLFGIDEDSKATKLQNGGVTESAYIISSNIHAFVRRAVFEHSDFYTLEYDKKMEILEKYADEVKKEAAKKAEDNAGNGVDFGGLDKKDEGGKPGEKGEPKKEDKE